MKTTQAKPQRRMDRVLQHPLLRKYLPLVHEDLGVIYSRDLIKWLIIAPIIGVTTGLAITAIAVIILGKMWPAVMAYYLGHHWAIVPSLVAGFAITGLIMQYLTPDPDEHSTEEIIRSYHEHQGDIDMRPFFPKLLAAVTTVGFGGSAALEGPSIYGGAAIGSWLWTKLGRLRLDSRDRRIMLICGAAAGMSAVFRAPLTGIVFALEMPYRDDLAHEALVPSLIASVVSFVTMSSFLGGTPLFNFAGGSSYTGKDIVWCALLGVIIGLIAMAFVVTFRRARTFFVKNGLPHWLKLAIGGLLTGLCGILFLHLYHGTLMPIGPNYEAVGEILGKHHSSGELLIFSALKLAATLFTLAVGGVSAMFVPLFLTGGAIGTAFAQSIVHSPALGLYAAVGMASFISAGYKTPLAAVVFVAEATGGHAFIIPALIGAAVAYAVSGDASASGDQRLHEGVKIQELGDIFVREVMQRQMVSVQASLTLREFASTLSPHHRHEVFPVFEDQELLGTVALWSIAQVPVDKWSTTTVREITELDPQTISPECDVMEALRLLAQEHQQPILLVISKEGRMEGVVTKSDILQALTIRRDPAPGANHEIEPFDPISAS
ncbi:chloride channel protein [Granulicella mallensis]|uniref:CIC family chloride channel protein n=1 Tax=Granulicella mallensis TaxID=940614 RepID=A0A7W8E990_9BACT|nr:chloride channel protein [Granulicella mallensis]MBB5062105.1 CIC family chloride channel protein [Granulicella mallensis]